MTMPRHGLPQTRRLDGCRSRAVETHAGGVISLELMGDQRFGHAATGRRRCRRSPCLLVENPTSLPGMAFEVRKENAIGSEKTSGLDS